MDSFDSRIAHSSEVSTDEHASSPSSAEDAPAAVPHAPAGPADRRFATLAEEEAYWTGVRIGAEAARNGAALPLRHRPADM